MPGKHVAAPLMPVNETPEPPKYGILRRPITLIIIGIVVVGLLAAGAWMIL